MSFYLEKQEDKEASNIYKNPWDIVGTKAHDRRLELGSDESINRKSKILYSNNNVDVTSPKNDSIEECNDS